MLSSTCQLLAAITLYLIGSAKAARPLRRGRDQKLKSNRLEGEQLEQRFLLANYVLPGIDFSPYIASGQDPNKGPGQITTQQLQQDIQVIAPNMNAIRTFGVTGDLAGAGQIIHAQGKQAVIGAWIGPDASANQAEIDSLVSQAIQGNVDIAVVGSEALLRGDVPEGTLISYINDVKTRLAAAGVNIPVTYADTYNVLLAHPNVLQAVDVVFANFYPFWEGSSVDVAMARLHREYKQLSAAAGGKPIWVSETGWPSAGQTIGEAVPSPENGAYYFEDFVSWARANNVPFFYFEAYNELWKVRDEGELGAYWGVWDANQNLKPGMDRVFDGQTLPDNWTNPPPGPPIIDFFGLPNTISTNIGTFFVSSQTDPTNVVMVDGQPIPAASMDDLGVFVVKVPLIPGQNSIHVTINSVSGQVVADATKTVDFDPGLSTGDHELLYVDAVSDGSAGPSLDGTIVIDLGQKSILGLLGGEHIRGISPDGNEIYMQDNTVYSTSTHQPIRTLPFSQEIPANSFLVSPTSTRLYSRGEVVDVTSNTLQSPLPVDITSGASWDSAPIPGGPSIRSDGSVIYAQNPVVAVDPVTGTVTNTGATGSFMSDIAVSPNGSQLLISQYSYAVGSLEIYDANTFGQQATVSGLGDFVGDIGFLPGDKAIVGSAGNPSFGGGTLSVIDLATDRTTQQLSIPLAEILTTVPALNEVFVSAGSTDPVTGTRLGVNDYVMSSAGNLALRETYFLGINRFIGGSGRPHNEQIRGIFYKPGPPVVSAGSGSSINEGDTFASSGSFVDPSADTWSATVDYGDGGGPQSLVLNTDKTFNLNHTYTQAGSYVVSVTVMDEEGAIGYGTVTVNVNEVAPTASVIPPASAVTGQTLSFTFQASDPSAADLSAGFSYTADWGDGSPTQTIPATPGNGSGTLISHAFSAAGSYNVQVTATDLDGVNSQPASSTLTVNTADTLTAVSSSAAASVYGQALTFAASVSVVSPGTGIPSGTIQLVIDGANFGPPVALSLSNGIPSATSAAIASLPAGPHSVQAIYSGDSSFNASNATLSGGQSVSPAPLTITAIDQSMNYGSNTLPTLTASYEGFVNGDSAASLTTPPVLSTTASTSSHIPGSPYPITVSGAVDANYNISYVAGNLTVTPAALTITADNQSMVYGGTLPTLTASYTGLVNNDTPVTFSNSPNRAPSLATVPSTSHAGSYAITVSGASDSDYSITFVSGTLTVAPAGTSLTVSSSIGNPVFGQSVTLTAVVSVTAPGGGTPTGTVQFQVNGKNFADPVAVGSNSGVTSAILNTSALPIGRLTITALYSGDNNFVGSQGDTSVVSGTDNQRWLNLTYLNLLNRAVDSFGLGTWTAALSQGASRTAIAQAIEGSPEYFMDAVQAYYRTYLHRDADPSGLSSWVGSLEAGATNEQVQAGIIGSPEYFQNRGGGTTNGYLSALYQDGLGRAIDPAGQSTFGSALAAGATPGQVAAAIFASDEYRQDLVQADFAAFLHRPVDSFGLTSFLNALRGGARDQDLAAAILGSGEYFSDV